ncbi:MAG: CPBP family intramembrane metalloprotease [Candidatus Eremiobacteraeota bacterium]|nr:CPBP family intramembrane metalloprotease [Candidatus Eremiobacteraeota bacterium]
MSNRVPQSVFGRELRRTRRPFRLGATIITVALALGAALAVVLLGASLSPVVESRFGSIDAQASPTRLCTEIAAYAALALVIFRRLPALARCSLADLGLYRPRRHALAGAFGTAVVLFGFRAAALVPYLTLVHADGHIQAGFERFTPQGWFANLLDSITEIFAAPVAEELLFRGVLFNALAICVGTVPAALGSGLLFGLSHGDFVLLPFITLDGIVLALVYRYTRNLYATMIVHGIGNFIAVVGSRFFLQA